MVLMKFAECGNDDGTSVFPKAHNVYMRCSIARSTYRKFLKEFQEHGIIAPDSKKDEGEGGGRGKARHWTLNLQRIAELYPHVKNFDDQGYRRALAALKKSPYENPLRAAGIDGADSQNGPPGGQFQAGQDGNAASQKGPPGGQFKEPERVHRSDEKGPPGDTKGSIRVDPINPLKKTQSNPCAPGGDPDGPPDPQGESEALAAGECEPPSSMAAELRAIMPKILDGIRSAPRSVVEYTLKDAFVTERLEDEWQDSSPDGKIPFGDPVPVVVLKLALADQIHSGRLFKWRREIVKATGYVLSGTYDHRAKANRKRREEKEAVERAALAKSNRRRA